MDLEKPPAEDSEEGERCTYEQSAEHLVFSRDAGTSDLGSEERVSRSPSPSASPSPPSPSSPAWHQRNLLHKPLEELTEEDIMQLTREDCRRYLKEKGMRRPSWNKSQAIQQVLSLKGLFDSKPDHATSLWPSCSQKRQPTESLATHKSSDLHEQGAEIMPQHPLAANGSMEGFGKSQFPWKFLAPSVTENLQKKSTGPVDKAIAVPVQQYDKSMFCSQHVQNSRIPRQSSAQLTIFYSGMVNVYDDVPADKVEAIMLLATNADSLKYSPCLHCQEPFTNSCCTATTSKSPIPYVSYNPNPVADVTMRQSQSAAHGLRIMQSDQAPSREISLQRYLEKRRERYRLRAL